MAAHVVTSSMTKITGELGWKLAVFKLLLSKPVMSTAIQQRSIIKYNLSAIALISIQMTIT